MPLPVDSFCCLLLGFAVLSPPLWAYYTFYSVVGLVRWISMSPDCLLLLAVGVYLWCDVQYPARYDT